MPAHRLSFHSDAIREAWEARGWYGLTDSSVADRFTIELWRAIATALEAPERLAADPNGKRRIRVHGFPYVVIYYWEPPVFRVLAVAHASRDPEYWSGRR